MRGSTLLALALLTWVQITHGQVAQTASWTTVFPGFDSQVLLNHKNGMWAAGSGGSIAVSVDAGQHWQKKHEESRDGLLLAVGFVGDKFGYAAGTGTHLLVTEDEGETWKASFEVPEVVFQAAFGDAQHGVIRTRSSLLSTANGGKTWIPVKPSNDPGWQAKYPYTDGMAALDPMHLIIRVSEGQYGGGEFLWTSDGGMTWTANSPPSGAGGGRVFVAEGKYWSVGGEVVGKDKPGGGLNVPMAIRSQDGGQWDHLPAFREACHWTGCRGCTAQGCFAGRSSFVPFSRILEGAAASQAGAPIESFYRFPEHLLSAQWSRTNNTLCLLTRGNIQCTTLTPVIKLDTQDDQAQWENGPFPPLSPSHGSALASASIEPALKKGVHCIRCDLDRLFISNQAKTGPVDIQISFTIETSGLVGDLVVSGPVPDDVSEKLRNVAHGWLFEPYMLNGQPTQLGITLRGKIMVMNPEKRS
jgi:photosystem II stability/assembly factor-like uncharacterized protein